MHVCIPIDDDHGLESRVCRHFGLAAHFLIVDTESGTCRTIPNEKAHHVHGSCEPLLALRGESLDGVVVAGIGRGALERFELDRIRVFRTDCDTVSETIAALRSGALWTMQTTDLECGD